MPSFFKAVFFLSVIAISSTSFSIVNGRITSANSPFTKFTVATFTSNFDTGEREACTGTLIDPQVVLTAAHCVVGNDVRFVTFGPKRGDMDSGIAVDQSLVHPQYKQNGAYDLALMHLSKPAPAGTQPISLVDDKVIEKLQKFSGVVIVGFGKHGYTFLPLDTKAADFNSEYPNFLDLVKTGLIVCRDAKSRTGCRIKNALPADGFMRDGVSSIENLSVNQPQFTIIPHGKMLANVMNGDSGGPALVSVGGQLKQIGIVTNGCALLDPTSCSSYVNVHFFEDWIRTNTSELLKGK